MKPIYVIALQVGMIALALTIYHQVRGHNSNAVRSPASRHEASGSAEVLRRIEVLEARLENRARLDAETPDWEERLAALEAALESRGKTSAATKPKPGSRSDTQPDAKRKPGAADIAWFRSMRAAVRKDDAVKKNRKLVDAALDKLTIRLTDEQRDAVHRARAQFGSRVNEIWSEVKRNARATEQSGGKIDVAQLIRRGEAQIQEEFAAEIGGAVSHPTDAAAVAEAVYPASGK